jgi:accessory colonization factor AcfC
MAGETELVRLPVTEQLWRGTPIALTARSEQRELALAFVAFLRSPPCHALFRKAGWR